MACAAPAAQAATYWNLFNIEGEASQTATYVTYATLTDMLRDTNRLGSFDPNAAGFGKNIVGTGSDLPFFAAAGAAVPEPAAWAMMLLGFGMVGTIARRRTGGQRYRLAACRSLTTTNLSGT